MDPRWTAGGRRIVFSTFSSPEDARWAVDVDENGDSLSFSPPRLLFRGRFAGSFPRPTWDVDGTGERFVLIGPENDQTSARDVVLAQGWSRELARRVEP